MLVRGRNASSLAGSNPAASLCLCIPYRFERFERLMESWGFESLQGRMIKKGSVVMITGGIRKGYRVRVLQVWRMTGNIKAEIIEGPYRGQILELVRRGDYEK